MMKTRTICLLAALVLAPLSIAFAEAPYRHAARQVSHSGGCASCGGGGSCGCEVPCAAPCGSCCDPCCVPLIPAVLNRIDCVLQRVFSCRCYDPCACGVNCYECAGCSGGCDGGCSTCGGGSAGHDYIGQHQLSPLPRAARVNQSGRTGVTRGVSAPRRAAPQPTPAPARVKTASTNNTQPIAASIDEEVGSQVQRTSYSTAKKQPSNPLRR